MEIENQNQEVDTSNVEDIELETDDIDIELETDAEEISEDVEIETEHKQEQEPTKEEDVSWEEKYKKMADNYENVKKALKSERTKNNQPKEVETFKEKEDDFNSIEKELKELGYDDTLIKALKVIQNKSSKESNALKRDSEYKELKANPLYSDIEEKREEIEKFAIKTNISMKQAYHALYGEEKINSSKADLRRQIEQEVAENLKKKQNLKVDTSSSGIVDTKPKAKLSDVERQVARASGMTDTEYYAFKHNIKNTEQYKKFQSK